MAQPEDTGRKIIICAVPARNGVKSTFSIVLPPAARKSAQDPPAPSALKLLAAPRGKPSPQAAVVFERLADRRDLRLVGLNCCREDALETIIVNSREVLTQERGGKFIRPQNSGAQLCTGPAKEVEIRFAVVLRTKPVDLV